MGDQEKVKRDVDEGAARISDKLKRYSGERLAGYREGVSDFMGVYRHLDSALSKALDAIKTDLNLSDGPDKK